MNHLIAVLSFPLIFLVPSIAIAQEKTHYTIVAPSEVQNGYIVPFGVSFSPPLKQGDTFKVKIGNLPLAEVVVGTGRLEAFSFRTIMFSNPSVISIECVNCAGESFKSSVSSPAIIPTSSIESPVKEIKTLLKNGEMKFLISYDSPQNLIQPGFFTVDGESFKISLKMSNLSVANPFVGFKGSISPGKYCYSFKNQFETNGCASF